MVLLDIITCSDTDALALHTGRDTDTQSRFNSTQGRKAPRGTARSRIWPQLPASQLQKAPRALSSAIAVGTSLHQAPLTGLSAPYRETQKAQSSKATGKTSPGRLEPEVFPLDCFLQLGK